MDEGFFYLLREPEAEDGMEIEQYPFSDELRGVQPELRRGWIDPVECTGQEIECRLIVGCIQADLSVIRDFFLQSIKHLRVAVVKLRHDLIAAVGEEEEHEVLQTSMVGLRWVNVGENPVTAGEFSRRHVSPGEDVPLFDDGDVEERWKALSVQQTDDFRIGGDEGARWHVDPEDR
ncbi:unnamed protein product [Cuscuta europaea]|uniref:Uncharacterized protein n=1 Tax=Cuscuta europaea TaxID=41803 RepID=A0A9P0YV32_CUSEU|nr:unnamed protein product [Cuscuta europaea]